MNRDNGDFITMRCDFDQHFRNNLWCMFPKVNYECGYKKLYDGSLELEEEENARIPFFLDDFNWAPLEVECQVAASTLCTILAEKNGIKDDPKWCIVEYIKDRNLRRVMEDSEDVLRSHEEFLDFSNGQGRLYFEYINNKELMFNPEKSIYCPYAWFKEETLGCEYFRHGNKHCFVVQSDSSITMLTECWYKTVKNIWTKAYLLLQGGYVKVVNREVALKIIKNNKPCPLDIEKQVSAYDGLSTFAKMRNAGIVTSYPYHLLFKTSSSALLSEPFIQNPRGLYSKKLKVYTHIAEPYDSEPPTAHIVVLIEKDLYDLPTESSDEIEKSIKQPNQYDFTPKRTSWSSSIKAKLIGKKKEIPEESQCLSCNGRLPSYDDIGWSGVKSKKNPKPKKTKKNDSYIGVEPSTYIENFVDEMGFKYQLMNLAFESSLLMKIWVDLLRFTKNGNFLRMSSNSFYSRKKALEVEEIRKELNQKTNYFVNMDFTGSEGKIIEELESPSTSRLGQDSYSSSTRDDEETVEFSRVDVNNIVPRGILKRNKSTGQKKNVVFSL